MTFVDPTATDPGRVTLKVEVPTGDTVVAIASVTDNATEARVRRLA